MRRREPPHKPRTTPRSHRGSAALLLWPRRTDLLFQPALRASSRVAPPEVNSAVTPCTLCFALEFIAPAAAETYARTPALRFPSRGPGWTCSPVSLLFIRLHSPSLPVCGSTSCRSCLATRWPCRILWSMCSRILLHLDVMLRDDWLFPPSSFTLRRLACPPRPSPAPTPLLDALTLRILLGFLLRLRLLLLSGLELVLYLYSWGSLSHDRARGASKPNQDRA